MWNLVRTDKNGTKYYEDYTCPKCGGSGYISCYGHVEGGRCFKCNGSGTFYHTKKEYTDEYAQKLKDRRIAKAKKGADKRNEEFFKKVGFSNDGTAWVVIGDTYSIKDALKSEGAKFDRILGWHFDHEVENHLCFTVNVSDVCSKDYKDDYDFNDSAYEFVNALREKNMPKSNSQFLGEIGDKVRMNLKYIGSSSYTTHYTWYGEDHYILKFEDESGNAVIWNTSSPKCLDEGKTYSVAGTIKEHKTYKGVDQTVLNRCRIS